jgi:hypothetical protein
MKTNIQTFIEKLQNYLFVNQNKKSVAKKLANPEQLAEQFIREIGSDSQRLTFNPPKED